MIYLKLFLGLVLPFFLIYFLVLYFFDKIDPKDAKKKILVDGTSMTLNEYSSFIFTIPLYLVYLYIFGFIQEQGSIRQDYFLLIVFSIFVILVIIAILYVFKLMRERS